MGNSCPRVWHIQEQSICFKMSAFDLEPICNNISPVGSDIGFVQILKELFCDLRSLFIELEGVKSAIVPKNFRKSTGEGSTSCPSLHHNLSWSDVQLKQNGRVIHRIQNLSLPGQSLSDECRFGLQGIDKLVGLIECFDPNSKRFPNKTCEPISSISGLQFVPSSNGHQPHEFLGFVDDCIIIILD